MKKIVLSWAFFALMLFQTSSVFASEVSQQVTAAVAKGDFTTVQTLLNNNGSKADEIAATLVQLLKTDVTTSPETATQIASFLSGITAKLSPDSVAATYAALQSVAGTLTTSPNVALTTAVSSAVSSYAKAWAALPSNTGKLDAQLAQTPGVTPPNLPHASYKPSGE